jgi:hypothetical protein
MDATSGRGGGDDLKETKIKLTAFASHTRRASHEICYEVGNWKEVVLPLLLGTNIKASIDVAPGCLVIPFGRRSLGRREVEGVEVIKSRRGETSRAGILLKGGRKELARLFLNRMPRR